jgi:hemoglobin
VKAIETRADLRALVDEFYRRLLADVRIAHLFERLDLDVHLPILVDFWSMMLLGEDSYRRNAFEKHVSLAIEDGHFDVWLGHWSATIDALFAGEKAEVAKVRARSVASIFRSKLRALGRLGDPRG